MLCDASGIVVIAIQTGYKYATLSGLIQVIYLPHMKTPDAEGITSLYQELYAQNSNIKYP